MNIFHYFQYLKIHPFSLASQFATKYNNNPTISIESLKLSWISPHLQETHPLHLSRTFQQQIFQWLCLWKGIYTMKIPNVATTHTPHMKRCVQCLTSLRALKTNLHILRFFWDISPLLSQSVYSPRLNVLPRIWTFNLKIISLMSSMNRPIMKHHQINGFLHKKERVKFQNKYNLSFKKTKKLCHNREEFLRLSL